MNADETKTQPSRRGTLFRLIFESASFLFRILGVPAIALFYLAFVDFNPFVKHWSGICEVLSVEQVAAPRTQTPELLVGWRPVLSSAAGKAYQGRVSITDQSDDLAFNQAQYSVGSLHSCFHTGASSSMFKTLEEVVSHLGVFILGLLLTFTVLFFSGEYWRGLLRKWKTLIAGNEQTLNAHDDNNPLSSLKSSQQHVWTGAFAVLIIGSVSQGLTDVPDIVSKNWAARQCTIEYLHCSTRKSPFCNIVYTYLMPAKPEAKFLSLANKKLYFVNYSAGANSNGQSVISDLSGRQKGETIECAVNTDYIVATRISPLRQPTLEAYYSTLGAFAFFAGMAMWWAPYSFKRNAQKAAEKEKADAILRESGINS